jgi:hypothetical protein
VFAWQGRRFIYHQNGIAGGLPGPANATIRSPAAIGIQFATVPVRHHPKPKALIYRVYLFATKARRHDRPVLARLTISLPSSIG